jgi:hypothetical protein
MNKPTVWACKEQVTRNMTGVTAMDFSPAEAYGELRFITRTDLPFHADSTIRAVWEDDVNEFVKNYNPVTDYIITTGQPSAIFAMGFALGRVNKMPRFLVWRREDNAYRVLNLST